MKPPTTSWNATARGWPTGLDKRGSGRPASPHTVARVGSMLTLFFAAEPVTDWPSAAQCDTERYARYFWELIERGVYMPCSQYEALFVSAAHGDEEIDATLAAASKALACC